MDKALNIFVSYASKNANLFQVLCLLKEKYTYKEWCTITDNSTPLVKKNLDWFFGAPLPKSYSELGLVKATIPSFSLENEIDWMFLSLRNYYTQIIAFLELKDEYEKSVLSKDYKSAIKTLTKIERDICFSAWTLENRYLLINISDDDQLLEDWQNEFRLSEMSLEVKFLSYYYNLKTNVTSGENVFRDRIIAAFDTYNEPDREVLIDNFTFKFNPLFEIDTWDPQKVLEGEFKFSIIDRFLTLVKVISCVLVGGSDKISDRIWYKIETISRKIKYKPLLRMLSFKFKRFDESIFLLPKIFLSAQDSYLKGDMDKAVMLCRKGLEEHPFNFDLMKLWGKVNNSRNSPVSPKASDWYENILISITNVYDRTDSAWSNASFLYKFYSAFDSFSFSSNLLNFVFSELHNSTYLLVPSTILSESNTIDFYKIFPKEIEVEFLNKANLIEHTDLQEVITYDYRVNFLKGKHLDNVSLVNKNELRVGLIKVDHDFFQSNYSNCIDSLCIIKNKFDLTGYFFEKVTRRLYYSLFRASRYDNAIVLYVQSFISSSANVTKIDTSVFIKSIRKEKFKLVKPTIYLPIFYLINDGEETEIFTAIRLVLRSENVKKPSELDTTKFAKEINYLIYFLDKVCIVEYLKHDIIYESIMEMHLERINIIHVLQQIDPDKNEIYEKELGVTTKKLIVLNGMRKLDESKIFINEDGIYESQHKIIEKLYENILIVARNTDIEYIADDETFSSENSKSYFNQFEEGKYSNIIPFLNEIFVFIKSEYLFSKYGLDNYLSTRIRHGVFELMVRNVFESLHLVTRKSNSGDRYINNAYWPGVLTSISQDKWPKVQTALSAFSRKIDEIILNFVNNKIQIKTEIKNRDGLLSYVNLDSHKLLTNIIKSNLDVKGLFYSIFDYLWGVTELGLASVRSYIQSDLFIQFDEALRELESSLDRIGNRIAFQDLYEHASICRSQVHSELEKISNWFVRPESQMNEVYLTDIIEITHQYLCKSSLMKKIQLDLKGFCKYKIQGRYYVPISDLFRIFLENCMKRSGIDDDVPLTIIIQETDSMTCKVKVINPIGKSVNIDELKSQLEYLKMKPFDIEQLIGESKSGFTKARNILQCELCNINNDLDYNVNEFNQFQVDLTIDFSNISS